MDRSSAYAAEKPKSVVPLSDLPTRWCAGLAPNVRQTTISTESPNVLAWLDTPECVNALCAWLRANPNTRLRLYMREPRLLAAVLPRLWSVFNWHSHQVQTLVPTRETLAQLDGILFEGHSVLYTRRDTLDWHHLLLPSNAIAIAIAQQLASGVEFASEQSLGTTGLAG